MYRNNKIIEDSLTFDDVLLVPSYSEILPYQVNISSKLTRDITLNSPIISSAMDTVTESSLAIAIAREGGIGVVHKNMSIKSQANEVKVVKRAENAMIYKPITVEITSTVGKVLKLMKQYKISGIPVIAKNNILVGIVTNRDLRSEMDMGKSVEKVMTKAPLITTDISTTLEEARGILQKNKIEKLPVIDVNNKLISLVTYKDIVKAKDKPNACKDNNGCLRVAGAIGITPDVFERIEALIAADVDVIAIDTAHGHTKGVIDTLKEIKKSYPNTNVIVGNIATKEAARALANAGADAIKVGIGPGSICTTRVITGVGVPQLTAILDVCKYLKDTDIPVIADGGLRYSGDIVKALAAGAHAVMAGSIFAGAEESPGETIIYNGRKYKSYRGMGSIEAMQKGSKDRYFQDMESDIKKLVPEGISARVSHQGTLYDIVYQLLGGLRAGMGYCGAKNIQELHNAKFIKISNAGVRENHPHDITITREAPNYSGTDINS